MSDYRLLQQIAANNYADCILKASDQDSRKTCGKIFVEAMATIETMAYLSRNTDRLAKTPEPRSC